MKVYIIKGYWDYEGSEIIGVELDEEKAIALGKEESKNSGYDGIIVELWDDSGISNRTSGELDATLNYADDIWSGK